MDAKVIIVGAGVSGLCMAMTLRRAGCDSFLVLEKAPALGGTWQYNNYPGCASDVPAYIYTFSFSPRTESTKRYGSQQSILNYLRVTTQQLGITPNIRFNTTVVKASFDRHLAEWELETEDGKTYRATFLVLAVGILHQPAWPDIPGLQEFHGSVFHSARWNHSCSLARKRVAIIGTGASSVQIVPEVAEHANQLYVFQRTPTWVLPRRDNDHSPVKLAVFSKSELCARMYRGCLRIWTDARILAFTRYPWLMHSARARALRQLRMQVPDPELQSQLTPDYEMGCKQLAISSKYYPALCRDNVELVTAPIAEIEAHAVRTADGVRRAVDIIVLATGFRPFGSLGEIRVRGIDGQTLREAWHAGPEAFLGICVTGFPNLFLMGGPNSGLAHTSLVFMIECQARYIVKTVKLIGLNTRFVEVQSAAQNKFNVRLRHRLSRTVWEIGGCGSWHLDESGINRVLWPGSTFSYWLRTRKPARRNLVAR